MPQWENDLDKQYKELKDLIRKNIKKFKKHSYTYIDSRFFIKFSKEDTNPEIEMNRAILETLFNIEGTENG